MTTMITVLLALSTPADAFTIADCAGAPHAPNSASCDISGTDVCTDSGTTITCDVPDASCAGTISHAVWDYQGSGTSGKFTAWGTCNPPGGGAATNWCCLITDDNGTPITDFNLIGTDDVDQLKFINGSRELSPGLGGTLHARQRGKQSGDNLIGSECTDADYLEDFFGGAGNDDIDMGDADDDTQRAYGGDDDDTITGGPAGEVLVGGDGADTLAAYGGDDLVCEICPDASDALLGGGDDDILWAGNGSAACMAAQPTIDGGADNDLCGHSGWTDTNCEGTQSGEPSECTP